MSLEIKDLHINVDGKEIVKGVDINIKSGEVVVLMGQNGSGKSTLANSLMGHPKYTITKGKILLNNEDITTAKPHERSKKGLFLSFQYPTEISGVTMANFLKLAVNSRREKPIPILEFQKLMKEKMGVLKMDKAFSTRYLNAGFSGGEKKKAEILQMAILNPELAILDETDSGLDVSALKIVGEGINKVKSKTNMGVLLITHYERVLKYIQPDKVYIMNKGVIIKEGGPELAYHIDKHGYDNLI